MGDRVEWDDDVSRCGRWSIHSEHVRGERRWYWLVCHTQAALAVHRRLDLDGSTDKRTVRRQAQRIADVLATEGVEHG